MSKTDSTIAKAYGFRPISEWKKGIEDANVRPKGGILKSYYTCGETVRVREADQYGNVLDREICICEARGAYGLRDAQTVVAALAQWEAGQ
jgi:hypothetical protein